MDLTGRTAKCSCGRATQSSADLPFFEYKGAGSSAALDTCKRCAYFSVAHTFEVMEKNSSLKCKEFEAHGAFEFDGYYCGCWGWD